MKKFFQMGGVIAGAFLVLFGIGAIAIGFTGRAEVRDNIAREAIVGSPDMTPGAIKEEAAKAGLTNVDLPTCNVAGKAIDSGSRAKCFASYMRIHTLEATGGYTYAQMGRFAAKPDAPKAQLAVGGGTNNSDFALVDPTTKRPVANAARDIWVTETALTTALNTSFFAEQVSLFSIVMGIALLLVGIGLGILAFAAFRWVPAQETKRKKAALVEPKPLTH
jgi:uncharacterized membrane protein YidH (DUF202 family)